METRAEVQEERIVSLEEELATLWWKKTCTCGEKGKETVIASGSGELSELEYADKEEGTGSDSSYHSPTVAQNKSLLVFGSPAVEGTPILLSTSCGCLALAVRIKDDVKMIVVPRENTMPILVQVEGLPRYDVGVPHTSCGCPVAHYCSSTHHHNCYAKQLGIHPYLEPEFFIDQDLLFPCVRIV